MLRFETLTLTDAILTSRSTYRKPSTFMLDVPQKIVEADSAINYWSREHSHLSRLCYTISTRSVDSDSSSLRVSPTFWEHYQHLQLLLLSKILFVGSLESITDSFTISTRKQDSHQSDLLNWSNYWRATTTKWCIQSGKMQMLHQKFYFLRVSLWRLSFMFMVMW